MSDIQQFDFTLLNDEYEEIIFRFLPNDSHCHSFDEQPPMNWNGVYKVYYSFSIIRFEKDKDTGLIESATDVFSMYRDECSILTDLPKYIRGTLYSKKISKAFSLGQPGSEWEIDPKGDYIKFTVFDNCGNNGYRFWLNEVEAMNFADYLDKMNDYMLKHGEPI